VVSAAEYLRRAAGVVGAVAETQRAAIEQAGAAVADALAAGHRLWAFGTGHSALVAEELYGRAGGLADVRAVLESSLMIGDGLDRSTALERLTGVAAALLAGRDLAAGDVVVIASNSGRNAVPVEFAEQCWDRGAVVVAVTSLAHSRSVTSRAPSGRRLFEVADIVIDNCGVPGDAVVPIDGVPEAVGPTSTVAGTLIAQAIVVEACARLVAAGITPKVLRSANSDPPAPRAESPLTG